ncbi:TBC1 domain family member 1-like isoform X8 [Dreissena polymorpha]|uniref:TBC1 domain family member 1-like isoform X8 n=1 Tax=Dreissena polymorpha TaxID=45954 RepID=UPI002263DAF5|nr:TBC1 domain family member 1-like isoform X8 [Dreissena polymorpha]
MATILQRLRRRSLQAEPEQDYLLWNQTAMLSCWKNVHGREHELGLSKLERSISEILLKKLAVESTDVSNKVSWANAANVVNGIEDQKDRSGHQNSVRKVSCGCKGMETEKNPSWHNFNCVNYRENVNVNESSKSEQTEKYLVADIHQFNTRLECLTCKRRGNSVRLFQEVTNIMSSNANNNNNVKHKDYHIAVKETVINDTVVTKKPAYRQSSFPETLIARKLLKSDIKRNSLPVTMHTEKETVAVDLLPRKPVVEKAQDVLDTVPELFQGIRKATQREMEPKDPEPAKACYEVMYVGRAKVKGKKVLSSHIDDLVARLEAKDSVPGLKTIETSDSRRRHKSDSSIKSLPTVFDECLTSESGDMQKMKIIQGVELHLGSNEEINRTVTSGGVGVGSEHHFSDGALSSTENVNDGLSLSNSSDQLRDMFHSLRLNPDSSDNLGQGQGNDLHDNEGQSLNRTMLFRIGQSEISLISLDKKQTIIERNFKNISSVSQGNAKPDVFGFISREPGSVLVCHLLRCCSNVLVDEIMADLRVSFRNAYQQSRQQTQQICIHCPLHQYHNLCKDINGQSAESAYSLLCKRIQQLPEKDAEDLYRSLQNENPQSHEESVESLMIHIRKLCEVKQQNHTHISDSAKGPHKTDFFLGDMKSKPNKSAFEFIRNKARKTLTTSFESLLTNVHHKTEEVKEVFRHRSGTNENEGGSFSRSLDHTSPDASPAPSPGPLTKDKTKFDFSSPPPSPEPGRPRAATVGAKPDPDVIERAKSRQLQELQDRRKSSDSPMKHMFILANCSSPSKRSSLSGEDDLGGSDPQHGPSSNKRVSWRQAIFNRVVTPSKHPSTPTLEEAEEGEERAKKTKEELRALWRKAILETLLLIRMERENIDLQARQDEADLKRQKLDYVEITPCLREVSKQWDEMLTAPGRPKVVVSNEKLLDCVKQGVPQAKRGEIWWLLVEQHRLKFPALEAKTPVVEYFELLKQLTNHQHAILIDLGRTFPGHPYFSLQLGSGQLALFNLLKAYSLMDQDVGYCQGLSFVAGILLMHMDELQAFEAWKHVMYNLGMRKQYRPNMIALQIELYQLTRLLHHHYRDLYEHLEQHDIAPTLYAAPWFLTLFASQFPLGFVARVFDLIFIQGSEVIFKVALVLLGNHKELIMQCNSFETIVEFIKTTLPEMGMIQMERVINQVFDLDISKQLQSYEVEYHVLNEVMMFSPPQKGDGDQLTRLEQTNLSLKQQNMELIEKLQHAHSHERSLEIMINNFQTHEAKLKSHIRALEIERAALLNTVGKLQQLVPEKERMGLDLCLPTLTPSMPVSPVHHGKPAAAENSGKLVGHDGIAIPPEVSQTADDSAKKADFPKSARFRPDRQS